ncbi:MAG: sigma-54-dependent Fis family transcriptional regulator [Gammaproteobacteria bacterium]|nr:MAG: sigma-54-dependent Fis family transcriptional regulator [Gammaproteobacteria bacterium]
MTSKTSTSLPDNPPVQAQETYILLVEDEPLFANAVSKRLGKAGYQCKIAGTLAEAERQVNTGTIELVLLDMRLPDGSGLDFLAQLRESEAAEIPVVVLTAYGELQDAVAAMKLKALDYLKKPIDLDELLITLETALKRVKLTKSLEYSHQRESRASKPEEILGKGPAITQLREQIERISELATRAEEAPPTVLILGETGSGKDLTARIVHRSSARRDSPFVHVDCAALPKDLIEAELFGHEKGAFTTAYSSRTGLIEAAEDGTVFLDEVGEFPYSLQSKLLAVLERRTFRRVGSSRERPTAAWFIAGTNRPLEEMVEAQTFRADLYFRLKVLTIATPPLRTCGDDIILLAKHFAEVTARRYNLSVPEFSADAVNAMLNYPWPGNIRELKHLVERAVLLCVGEQLTASALMLDDYLEETRASTPDSLSGMTLDDAEAALIRQTLESTAGNVSEASRRLGITRMALRYRMQKHGITPQR